MDGFFSTRFTILLLLVDETLERGETSVALFHVLCAHDGFQRVLINTNFLHSGVLFECIEISYLM